MRIVRSVCIVCTKPFTGVKKAKFCPDCRRDLAHKRSRSFLKNHPDYGRRKMREYRERLKQGIILQPNKSAAIHEAKLLASATRQGWKVELGCSEGKWRWAAQKEGVTLASGKEFDSFSEARRDFFEAVF